MPRARAQQNVKASNIRKLKAKAVNARRTAEITLTALRASSVKRKRSPHSLIASKRHLRMSALKPRSLRLATDLLMSYRRLHTTLCCPRSSIRSKSCSALTFPASRKDSRRRAVGQRRRRRLLRQAHSLKIRKRPAPLHLWLLHRAAARRPTPRARIVLTTPNRLNARRPSVRLIPSSILTDEEHG